MAYAQLSASRVRDAATLALEELQGSLGPTSSVDERARATRLRWLRQLAEASAQEDATHRYVTMTPEDFGLIAARYGEALNSGLAAAREGSSASPSVLPTPHEIVEGHRSLS